MLYPAELPGENFCYCIKILTISLYLPKLTNEPNKNLLLAGGEGLADTNSYDGGFSETTTASFSTKMMLHSKLV